MFFFIQDLFHKLSYKRFYSKLRVVLKLFRILVQKTDQRKNVLFATTFDSFVKGRLEPVTQYERQDADVGNTS